jgi:phospholipase C
MIADAKTKIKHVIIIMQENRTFDHFFGKYKPANNQKIDTIPNNQWCKYKYNNVDYTYLPGTFYSPNTLEADYNHNYSNATAILGDRKSMYLNPYNYLSTSSGVAGFNPDECLGMVDQYDIPAYWKLADNFVLQDRMFEPSPSWSKVSHLYLYSGWSATKNSYGNNVTAIQDWQPAETNYSWNSLGKHLWTYSTNWGLFQGVGWTKDPGNTCGTFDITAGGDVNPDFWASLKDFDDVQSGYTHRNMGDFIYLMNRGGETLIPKVCWIVPNGPWSDHPGSGWSDIKDAHGYVVSIIQRIMNNSSLWNSCAIFLSWDDWGGFYDHVVPPTTADGYGYGIRVPGLLISPYAKKGFVDRQTLSFDAYAKFIEDLFCNGTRVPTETSGGSRPQQRENEPKLGNLLYEFDFSRALAPITLPCGY